MFASCRNERLREQGVQPFGTLAQRFVDYEFAAEMQKVEDNVGGRNLLHERVADAFSTEALLQRREWKRVTTGFVEIPSENLAVENRALWKSGQPWDEFG